MISRTRHKCLRTIDEKHPTRQQLYDTFRVRQITVVQKFIADAIEDGYVKYTVADQRYFLTKEGRRLLYELDRHTSETIQYALTTFIAVAALVVSVLAIA